MIKVSVDSTSETEYQKIHHLEGRRKMASSAATAIQVRRQNKRRAEENPAYQVVSKELRFLQSSVERGQDSKWSVAGKVLSSAKSKKK